MSMANTRKPKTRRERSEKFLRKNGIMVDPALPDLPDENNASVKPPEEAVKRAICALCTARLVFETRRKYTESSKNCAGIIARFGLESELTPDERKYFALAAENAPEISGEEAWKFHWRIERSMPLIWACGLLGENDLPFPSGETCTYGIFETLNACQSFSELMSKVKMHTLTEILDNMDECYRMCGACVKAKNKNPSVWGYVMPEVVCEQLKGFGWLVGLNGCEDWDKIEL